MTSFVYSPIQCQIMHPHFVALAQTVSRETGVPTDQILLLRHASENIHALVGLGGTVEEYTALQPVGSKYDFLHVRRPPVHVVVVIVYGSVYNVYQIEGVEAV